MLTWPEELDVSRVAFIVKESTIREKWSGYRIKRQIKMKSLFETEEKLKNYLDSCVSSNNARSMTDSLFYVHIKNRYGLVTSIG